MTNAIIALLVILLLVQLYVMYQDSQKKEKYEAVGCGRQCANLPFLGEVCVNVPC